MCRKGNLTGKNADLGTGHTWYLSRHSFPRVQPKKMGKIIFYVQTRFRNVLGLTISIFSAVSVASEDYFYDEEAEDEVPSTHVPVFSVESQTFDVMVGDEVRLPCLADKSELSALPRVASILQA